MADHSDPQSTPKSWLRRIRLPKWGTMNVSRWLLVLGDLGLILVAVLGAFGLRLEFGTRFIFFLPQAIRMMILALLIKPFVYSFFGMYRHLWIYASIKESRLVILAVSTGSVVLSVAVVVMTIIQSRSPDYLGFPRAVLVIDWLLSLFLVGGSRFAMRALAEGRTSAGGVRGHTRHVLIVGAGDAGALVVREMLKNPQLNQKPVCFLDDDPNKLRQQIHGIPVVGKLDDLARMITVRHVDEVVIAIPSAPGKVIRKVADVCRLQGMPFRTMPGIYELIGGKVSVSRLRDVEITDLLRREPALIDEQMIGTSLGGKRIMITGAGGSIGRELCLQTARWGPASIILLGHGENSIFETLIELEENFPLLPVHPVVGDIRDIDRMTAIFDDLRPQVVFHAAAHKHVPLMEVNVEEAITNNVLGTRNVVEASVNFGIERLVMISTDKAIRPTSVMGATKRLAELIVLSAANRSGQAFSVVRFGNVLGSRGSVIPKFKRQIANGGPITITHPDMERYFMTIPEAVHLVLQAASMGEGGEVFVLNMGQQMRIVDLAEDLIRLSGLEPYKDVDIVFTGIRPGEKLSETLWDQWVQYEPTAHPDIVLLNDEDILGGTILRQTVNDLIHLAREGDASAIVRILDEFIPGAAVRSTPPPDMTAII